MPRFLGRSSESWLLFARRMKAVFRAEDVMKIIEGTELMPVLADHADAAALAKAVKEFEKRYYKAIDIMIQCLGDNPMRVVMSVEEKPKEMWDKLVEAYSDTSGNTKRLLWDSVRSKTFTGKKETMVDHISTLEMLFGQLEACGVPKDEDLQLSILFDSVGINQEYKQIVDTLRVGSDSLQKWSEVSKRLISTYAVNQRLKKNTSKENEQAEQRSARANMAGAQRKRTPKKCTYCKKLGHLEDSCFKNPESSSFKGNQDYRNQSRGAKESTNEGRKETEKKKKASKPTLAMAFVNSFNCNVAEYDDEEFIIDSGATHHICSDLSLFNNFEVMEPIEITLADASTVTCNTKGQVDFMMSTDEEPTWVRLSDVLFVEELCLNLVSPAVLDDHGISTIFGKQVCKLVKQNNNETIGCAYRDNSGLYKLDGFVKRCVKAQASVNAVSGLELWRRRLGHLSYKAVKETAKGDSTIDLSAKADDIDCMPCIEGKKNNRPHQGKLVKEDAKVGDTIFSDVCGPFSTRSLGKVKYFVTFVDGKSRYLEVMILKKKSEVFACVKKYVAMMANQHGISIKKFYSDNGGEFCNNAMAEYFDSKGIIHIKTAPYNPMSNGIAERINQTLMTKVRPMLKQANLPHAFWAEAVLPKE